MMQWGVVTVNNGGGATKVTLPMAFTSAIYTVCVCARVSGHTNLYYNKVYPNNFTLSAISIGCYGDLGAYWLAIGK